MSDGAKFVCVGMDLGTRDETIYSVRSGWGLVCVIPNALGAVTKLEVTNGGRVIAQTASGVPFLVPKR